MFIEKRYIYAHKKKKKKNYRCISCIKDGKLKLLLNQLNNNDWLKFFILINISKNYIQF